MPPIEIITAFGLVVAMVITFVIALGRLYRD